MRMAWNENHISLVGYAGGGAQLSHETHGISYYRFPLRVSRLSGTEDVLNVLVAQPDPFWSSAPWRRGRP
jgi:hypothetical protein